MKDDFINIVNFYIRNHLFEFISEDINETYELIREFTVMVLLELKYQNFKEFDIIMENAPSNTNQMKDVSKTKSSDTKLKGTSVSLVPNHPANKQSISQDVVDFYNPISKNPGTPTVDIPKTSDPMRNLMWALPGTMAGLATRETLIRKGYFTGINDVTLKAKDGQFFDPKHIDAAKGMDQDSNAMSNFFGGVKNVVKDDQGNITGVTMGANRYHQMLTGKPGGSGEMIDNVKNSVGGQSGIGDTIGNVEAGTSMGNAMGGTMTGLVATMAVSTAMNAVRNAMKKRRERKALEKQSQENQAVANYNMQQLI